MQFSAGQVLSKAINVTSKNFLTLFIISFIVMAPLGVIQQLLTPSAAEVKATFDQATGKVTMPVETSGTGARVVVSILSTVGQAVVAGAMAFAVFQSLRGKKPGVGECVKRGFATMLPVIGVSIVYAIGVGLGTLLLIVPGIIIGCMWYVSVPAAVVERLGVGAALSRSALLTKGNRMGIFVLWLIIFGLGMVVMLVLAGVLLGMGPIVGGAITILIGVFIALFSGTLSAVCYHDLRVIKDGVGIEEMAKVFD